MLKYFLFILFLSFVTFTWAQQNDLKDINTIFSKDFTLVISPKHTSTRKKSIIQLPLIFYQRVLSEQILANCEFTLSCSAFSRASFYELGIFRGFLSTTDRLTRCNGLAQLESPGYLMHHSLGKIVDTPRMYVRIQKKGELKDSTLQLIQSSLSLSRLEQEYFQEKVKGHQKKSVFLAGLYSSIIPGLGKYYVGHKYQALTSFIVCSLLASQTIESFSKSNEKRGARLYLSAGLFTLFYSGNIWGSISLVKKKRLDHYKQIQYEIHQL